MSEECTLQIDPEGEAKIAGPLTFDSCPGLFAAMEKRLHDGATLRRIDLGNVSNVDSAGLALLLASFAAVGIFMSALTEQPVIAAISSFGLLLLLWIVDWSGAGREEVTGLFHYLSLQTHLQSFLKGLFSTADLAYYLLLIATFLVLSIRRLDQQRLTG